MAPHIHDLEPPFWVSAVLSASASALLTAPALFNPLTMLFCRESPCWQQLQQQVARVCYSQHAAVVQHSSPRVRVHSPVYAASLSPVGRHFRKRQERNVGMNEGGRSRRVGLHPGGLTEWCGCDGTAAGGK